MKVKIGEIYEVKCNVYDDISIVRIIELDINYNRIKQIKTYDFKAVILVCSDERHIGDERDYDIDEIIRKL